MTVKLKTIIKNNFWIMEEDGTKVGTVNKMDQKNYQIFSRHSERPVKYTMNEIITKWGEDCFKDPVEVDVAQNITKDGNQYMLFGYPCANEPTNEMYEVQRKLPLYTKNNKSNSVHSAGYYIVEYPSNGWTRSFCPKLVTLERYPYRGPFKTKADMAMALKQSRVK
ncbi:MAG: hypothetical protein CMA64_10220 [Euryarchaeota archaeon]|jgi:hypothetical protein|nr:hypothetical protein [Euryarchaeota archaeon]